MFASVSGRLPSCSRNCRPCRLRGYWPKQSDDATYARRNEFWILDGSVTLYVGDAVIHAWSGDYAFGPRDVPHRYEVGPDGCRMLFICTPGGFEDLVREMSVPAASRTLAPPPDSPPDMELVAAIAVAHGCELLA